LKILVLLFDFVGNGILSVFLSLLGPFKIIYTAFHGGFVGFKDSMALYFFNLEFALNNPSICRYYSSNTYFDNVPYDDMFCLNLLPLILPPDITEVFFWTVGI